MISKLSNVFNNTILKGKNELIIYTDNPEGDKQQAIKTLSEYKMRPRSSKATLKNGDYTFDCEHMLIRGAQKVYFLNISVQSGYSTGIIDVLNIASMFLMPDAKLNIGKGHYITLNGTIKDKWRYTDSEGITVGIANRETLLSKSYDETALVEFMDFIENNNVASSLYGRFGETVLNTGDSNIFGYMRLSDLLMKYSDAQIGLAPVEKSDTDIYLFIENFDFIIQVSDVGNNELELVQRGLVEQKEDLPEFDPTFVVFSKKPPLPFIFIETDVINNGTSKKFGVYVSVFKTSPDFNSAGEIKPMNLLAV
jgi:hypothetical protein